MKHDLAMRAAVLASLLAVSTANAVSREELLSIEAGPNLAGSATVQSAGSESFRQILANAPASARARFSFGKIQFTTEWDPAPGQVPANDGLGPTFNSIACASCHINNGRGHPPLGTDDAFEALLIRWSLPGTNEHGGPKPLLNYGDQLQHRAIEGTTAEGTAVVHYEALPGAFADGSPFELRKPNIVFSSLNYGALPDDVMVSARLANALPGLGLLEAVPESTLVALADPNDSDSDGISGRLNQVWSPTLNKQTVGRFGWKANVATVAEQNAAAALGDMGITTPIQPIDNCPTAQASCSRATASHANEIEFQADFFEQLNRYVRMLAIPAQRNGDSAIVRVGAELFSAAGCGQCHVATLQTGAEVLHPELANQTIHPYTDLLLHDMGAGLADGRPDFLASGSEWRTAPLWGIGLTATVTGHEFYLHDGRARSLSEAILWHGGEAAKARDVFFGMPAESRTALLEFIQSL
jgi:CxxC motif-containing protein (DUF1111 family)